MSDIVYVNLSGRIGNNLFQVAAAISLAKKYQAKVVAIALGKHLPPPDNTISHFDYLKPYKDVFFREVEITDSVPMSLVKYLEPSFCYHELPFVDGICLLGFFQSEKYFDVPYVRECFSINEQIRNSLVGRYGELLSQNPVSINVRRGDFLLYPKQFPVCPVRYFRKCIDIIGRERCFIVTSDDVVWCKEHFVGGNFHVIEDASPLETLFLQSLCCDHIISNSTFSWWGAWLNPNKDKKVLAPRKWFGERETYLDTKDLLPEGWITVE